MRLLPIVQLIITFLPATMGVAADNPTYKEGLLSIPSVDTSEQVGKYLDVILKQTAEGTWQLLDFKETGKIGGGVDVAPIANVELIVINSFPVQVFLKATTLNVLNCVMLQANQHLVGNQFDVGINYVPLPANITCGMSVGGTLIKTIPLSVYGLKAGTYSYSVNGATGINVNGLTGAFNLTADNFIAGDTSL